MIHGSLAPWPDCVCGSKSWKQCQDLLSAQAAEEAAQARQARAALVDQERIDRLFWRGFDT
ncbi:hypothetical protein SEA_IDAHO_2 [Arthrobacter phage Idaho]|uniref:Uncharacterized protein n=1 Tax=Arthrobacter phage Idaho TaxID=2565509 RepID=A0A4D6TBJ1_9CAUD|nr:hypothetical protein QEX67_gp02 [Arthrobacter phage Idaho]QCG78267.1 hypothetical protein SEA_IDAHO_2 [Arthrobacter phage Idaho]